MEGAVLSGKLCAQSIVQVNALRGSGCAWKYQTSTGVLEHFNMGNQILDKMSAGWTDERHMIYISSMEASFVEQLHNHEHIANQNDSVGNGFKVLRDGVWEKLKFGRTNACARIGDKHHLPASPWIQHFRPRGCSSNARGDGAESLVGDHESGIQTIQGRTPLSHGREWEACKGENHLGESAEVSDQNFADDEVEVDAESSKAYKKRRLSSTSTTIPNDQVAPSENLFAATKAVGSKDALK